MDDSGRPLSSHIVDEQRGIRLSHSNGNTYNLSFCWPRYESLTWLALEW